MVVVVDVVGGGPGEGDVVSVVIVLGDVGALVWGAELRLSKMISPLVVGRRRLLVVLLLPLRDMMSPIIRLCSYFGQEVTWRERDFVIQSNVRLEPAE